MPDSYPLRLAVLRVLVLSLLLTLGARLYYLQVLDQDKLVQTANRQHVREVILPAPRGAVVDDRGRPLVTNRTSLVVSVNRSELLAEPDDGAPVLQRLGKLIKVPAGELGRRITPCGGRTTRGCRPRCRRSGSTRTAAWPHTRSATSARSTRASWTRPSGPAGPTCTSTRRSAAPGWRRRTTRTCGAPTASATSRSTTAAPSSACSGRPSRSAATRWSPAWTATCSGSPTRR